MKKLNCILLVDDNPGDNFYNNIIISEMEICKIIKAVCNGEEALTYLTRAGNNLKIEEYPKPDLMFLDINMPGMNGFEFLEKFAGLDERTKSDIVIVMLTSSSDPEDLRKAMSIKQVREMITKPLQPKTISFLLEKYMNCN